MCYCYCLFLSADDSKREGLLLSWLTFSSKQKISEANLHRQISETFTFNEEKSYSKIFFQIFPTFEGDGEHSGRILHV